MDNDNFPLFTKETFRRYKARLAAKATVQAANGMSFGASTSAIPYGMD